MKKRRPRLLLLIACCVAGSLVASGCNALIATFTPVPPTGTAVPSETPTASATPSPTASASASPSPSATATPSPTATHTPAPSATPTLLLAGSVIRGQGFVIQNEHPTLRIAIDRAWGLAEVERLVAQFKPGWLVRVRIVANQASLPLRLDGKGHGYLTYTKGALFSGEMATYDAARKEAAFFYYPAGEHFRNVGSWPVEPEAVQVADFSFSFKFITFLAMNSATYLAPGSLDLPPEAATERDLHSGLPRFSGGRNHALFTWNLEPPGS